MRTVPLTIAMIVLFLLSGCAAPEPTGSQETDAGSSPAPSILSPSPRDDTATEGERPSGWSPPPTPDVSNLTGRFIDENRPDARERDTPWDELQGLACPSVPAGEETDTPRLQVALPDDPWPQGEWRCITVVLNNTSERPYTFEGPNECSGIRLQAIDPERGAASGWQSGPMDLPKKARPQSCEYGDFERSLPPGERIIEHFAWDGSVDVRTHGPYVMPGDHELKAFGQHEDTAWEIDRAATATFAEGDVAPTVDCSQHREVAEKDPPRVQIRGPDEWSRGTWVCIEALFRNTADRTFHTHADFHAVLDVTAWDRDGDSIALTPPTGLRLAAPATQTHHFEPGDVTSSRYWWFPGSGTPGTYILTSDFYARHNGSWETHNTKIVQVS